MRLHKSPLCLLVVLGLAAFLIAFAQAKTESFMVQPGKELTRTTARLAAGDQCAITFKVMASDPTAPGTGALHFFMVLPNGTTSDYGIIGQFSINFFADTDGECQLHFDNSNSTESQLVTLNCETEHYVFGIPNMIFMLIVITVLLLFVAAGYVIMGKYG